MSDYYEKFFIEKPEATGTRVAAPFDKNKRRTVPAYRTSDGRLLKWSAEFALPEIGQRVYINMNGIGWAKVKGYFEADGWLGVMTLAENPPEWLRKQNERDAKDERKPGWSKAGIGCEFGTEILLWKKERTA